MDLEQVGLYVGVGRVEDQIDVGAARHLGHVLVAVDDLGNEYDLVLEHLDDALVLGARVVLLARVGQLAADRPHLPGDALGLEGPARAPLLEELEADGAVRGRRRPRLRRAQQLREVADLALHAAPERLRRATHVREVDEVAVDVHVADRADRVALLAVVGELAAGAVEEDRVEDARDYFVDLPALHRQLERDAAGVHLAASLTLRCHRAPRLTAPSAR